MKRQKINCSGNRSRRKPSGKKPLFLNLGKEVLSVYQRNDHPQRTSSYPINTSRIYRSPPVLLKQGIQWWQVSGRCFPRIPQSCCCCQTAPDHSRANFSSRRTSSGLTPWQRLWLSKISTYGQELAGNFWFKNCSLEKHQFPEKFCGKWPHYCQLFKWNHFRKFLWPTYPH